MVTSRKGRRRCLVLSSAALVSFFFLIPEDGFSQQDHAIIPPTPAAGRSQPLNNKGAINGVMSSGRKIQNEEKGCMDGSPPAQENARILMENGMDQKKMHDSFTSWITGTQNIHTILHIDMFPSTDEGETNIRGLAASRDINKGEIVVSIPFRAMISLDSIEKDPVLSNILSRKNRETYGWYDEMQLLIVFLLYHRSLGPSSPIYPYILILKSAPTDQMPFMWTREHLHKIYPNPSNGVRMATELIYDDVLSMHEEMIPVLARLYPDVFAEPVLRQHRTLATSATTDLDNTTTKDLSSDSTEWAYSYRSFLWAFAMVNSRHWRVPCDDLDRLAIRNSEEVDTENRLHGQSESKFPSSEEEASAAITQDFNDKDTNDVKDIGSGRVHTFLLPFADLLNFGEPCTKGEYNSDKGAFEITATCDIEKGREVTLWYTDECSDLVLANFGFNHPILHKCRSIEEWKRHSAQLETQLTETQEYVIYLKRVISDLEAQLKPCQDLVGLNGPPHRQGHKRIHLHRTDASFLDKNMETPVLDYTIDGQKLRSSIRRAGQVPFDDNL
jgi:hypothetical protein